MDPSAPDTLPDPATITGVQDLFARYAHRIDRRDFDGFGELFTADADYSLAGDEQQGREAITELMRKVMTAPGGVHIITNVSVRAATDGADGAFDAMADYLLTRRPEADAPFAIVGVGWYEATVVLDGTSWRFAALHLNPR
ncbi:MAG TPA: nuclear transport factor 2 family protein [Acidimicrobiia bacterium]|jgi:uncharacterized protein (TIGR02246 family)|nr:nuclear transport factor 2 family protein [Acidimicrobiia bacterium]